jgi:tripartite ATP-independent transporter DctM subunit
MSGSAGFSPTANSTPTRRRCNCDMVATLFIGCSLLLALGVPVAFALGGATLAAMLVDGSFPLLALPKYIFSGIDVFALEAVPFFILAAELMTGGALSEVLLRFASQFVGRFRGGMGHTNILTLTFFSGISGSALADAAGPGAIMIRMMKEDGYKPAYAAALTAATSILGPIIPPSISMIIYALAYPDVNLVGLLIAGVLPGIVIAAAMAIINHVISVQRNYRGSLQRYQWRDYVRNTWRALPALALPVLILGGIASGAFTPTEASVIAVFYALFAGRIIYRSLQWRALPAILARSALMTASVLIIVAMSAAFAWVLTISRVPQDLTEAIVSMRLSPLAFLFAVNLFLLVFGIFIEPLPGIVVLVPILAPIAHALGISDLQFGIIVIVNLTMGMLTPPVGGLLFVTTVVARVPLAKLIGELWPFLWAQIGVLALLTLLPSISTMLPGFFGYR